MHLVVAVMPHSLPLDRVVCFASFAYPTEACLDYQNANPDYPKLEKEAGVSGVLMRSE